MILLERRRHALEKTPRMIAIDSPFPLASIHATQGKGAKMRWSQIKKRIEGTFADSVKGRVEVFVTRYHHAHDGAGEAWIVIDGESVAVMGEIAYWKHLSTLKAQMWRDAGGPEKPNWRDPAQRALGWRTFDAAQEETRADEVFSDAHVKEALFAYLNLGIDEILNSDNAIIRAFGMLDRRFGKRRLAALDAKKETALLRRLHAFRCEAEGVTPVSAPECS